MIVMRFVEWAAGGRELICVTLGRNENGMELWSKSCPGTWFERHGAFSTRSSPAPLLLHEKWICFVLCVVVVLAVVFFLASGVLMFFFIFFFITFLLILSLSLLFCHYFILLLLFWYVSLCSPDCPVFLSLLAHLPKCWAHLVHHMLIFSKMP